MAVLLIVLVVLFCGMPLIKSVFSALEQDAPVVVKNTTNAAARASYALPTLGASFASQTTSDTLKEVPALKQKLGCNDPNVVSMVQLQQWMIDHDMF